MSDLFGKQLRAAKTPSAALRLIYNDAPEEIQDFLAGLMLEIILIDLPVLYEITKHGPTAPAAEATSTARAFHESLEFCEKDAPEVLRAMSATVRDASLQLAELLDKSVRRILLEDKSCNRHAALNLTAGHAKLTRCLVEIALTPAATIHEAN